VLIATLALISLLPIMLGFTFYVFDFDGSNGQKTNCDKEHSETNDLCVISNWIHIFVNDEIERSLKGYG